MRLSLYARETAARCFEDAGHDRARAGKLLRYKLGCGCPSQPGRACELNWIKLKEVGKLEDRRRPGRPRKVPCKLASHLAQIVGKGMPDGQRCNSIDAAINSSPALGKEIKRLGVCQRTLKSAIAAADPSLVQRRVAVKPKLSDQHKRKRREGAAKILARSQKRVKFTIFADESSFQLCPPKSQKVWLRRGDVPAPISDTRAKIHHPPVIHYLGAVSPDAGAVGFKLLTGTTGFQTPYKVSLGSTNSE